jgi:gamma-glutamylcyclotransferase (GGCT)/AIG2-like uncharacterized protein YtfP
MKENSIIQIFVYGSLRSGFHSPAYNYVSKYFTLIGAATVKGLLIDMGNYPVAIATNQDKFLVGELYQITHKEAFDFAIAQLDDYEGVNVEDDEEQLYFRTFTEVFVNDTTTTAWVYWFKGDITNNPIVASGDVLKYIEEKINN